MAYWLGQLQELPTALLDVALALIMVLDAMPIVGIAIPGDVAVLTAMGVSGPFAAAGALLWVVGGCLAGWSVSFAVGRLFGERIRGGRLGAWIGQSRWAAAERALGAGGRVLVVAPFLPVLNTLVPLAAGGLRMPYHRFVRYSALGATLWGGLYVGLGLATTQLGGLLPGQPYTLLATVAIGLCFGWVTLFTARRRGLTQQRGGLAHQPAGAAEPAQAGADCRYALTSSATVAASSGKPGRMLEPRRTSQRRPTYQTPGTVAAVSSCRTMPSTRRRTRPAKASPPPRRR